MVGVCQGTSWGRPCSGVALTVTALPLSSNSTPREGSTQAGHLGVRVEPNGADRRSPTLMKLVQVTIGHASTMVTAHTYADLYDSDLDRVADALDGLRG